jgi:hypothetical protein
LSEFGDEALVATGNVLFEVTLVMSGQVMVVEEVILVQRVENELAKAAVVEAMVFVLIPDSDVLLWAALWVMLVQNLLSYL